MYKNSSFFLMKKVFIHILQILINLYFVQSSPSSETEHWKKQYDELFAKVRPFQVSHLHIS